MPEQNSLRSSLLEDAGFRHAFFTRHGGVSQGPYSSLSFSQAAGDDPDHVRENLRRAAETLGVEPGRLYFLSQVHGTATVTLDGSESFDQVLHSQGDALLARRSDLACGVRTADCVPILVGDRASGAALAIHAGWRGAVRGVVSEAIAELRKQSGEAGDLIAAIGPHISLAAFEVGQDVAEELSRACPLPIVDRSFGPRPHVNLRAIVRWQLEQLGLGAAAIDDVEGCTVSEPERFFSYRRDGKHSGRHLSAIVPLAKSR